MTADPIMIDTAGGGRDTAPITRDVTAAEHAVRDARAAVTGWHDDRPGGAPWAARRAAADRALTALDNAARAVDAARAALIHDIEIITDAVLAADPSRCQVPWGVCPEHGNTLTTSGGRTRCRWSGCGRTWPGNRVQAHCGEPATALIADAGGEQSRLCAGHWADARERLIGVRLVRALPAPDGAR